MLRTHPTLKKKEAQISISTAEKHHADAAIMPNISVRAEYLHGSVYENDPVNDDKTVYVAVSFNPGAGLSGFSNIESAKYKVLQAEDEKMMTEHELKNRLVSDYTDYNSASMRVESMQRTIAASQKVLESYKRLFLAGKRQWLDLVNSSREVTLNLVQMASIRATLITSAYRLALQAGKLKFPRVPKGSL
jgi:adhesin transport system outer membrane protein